MGGLNHRNMGYKLDHSTALGFMSYYDLAYGHVILTGLGLGIVATWLSDKPEVTKITVLENNIHLINYFKTYGDLPNKVELIHEDAERYTGKCDVLLCSHLIMSPINGQKKVAG
jgi:spermidine synthase